MKLIVRKMGGGRLKKEDPIDHSVGIEVLKKIGDFVEPDDIILNIYCNDERLGNEQVRFLQDSYIVAQEKVDKIEEVLDIIE